MAAPTREQQENFLKIDAGLGEKTAALESQVARDRELHPDADVLTRVKAAPTDPKGPENASLVLGTRPVADGKAEWANIAAPTAKGFGEAAAKVSEDVDLGQVHGFDGSAGVAVDEKILDFDKPWTLATWVRWTGGEAAICSTMEMHMSPTAASYGKGIAVRLTADGRVETRLSFRWSAYAAQAISLEKIGADHWQHVAVSSDGTGKASGIRIFIDGAECAKEVLHDGMTATAKNFSMAGGKFLIGEEAAPDPRRLRGDLADLRLYPQALAPGVLRPWVESTLARVLVSNGPATRADVLRELLLRRTDPDYAGMWEERDQLLEQRRLLACEVPTTMVMEELSTPRETRLLNRGMYDAPGEIVQPGVPEGLLGTWPKDAPRNRLGLARWLTQPEHPLTARVAMNRFWQQLFGTGLVKTADDFGFQGEYPAHLELLDWLAREFVSSGWSTKAMFRQLVLSATYRQASAISPAALERDPENRLLARGPRMRLAAEEIRDHALAVSGLLRHRLGGPGVFPAQPDGLYKGIVVESNYPGTSWTDSKGDDLYRRSIYTYWKRTVPYPMLNVFDAPDREVCSVRRSRTNTPLQALTLMNEPSMVEAGRQLGGRMLREGGNDDAARLAFGFRAATSRLPRGDELAVLIETLEHFRKDFTSDGEGAKALLKNAQPDPELAAYAALGGLLLNLDETVTKN